MDIKELNKTQLVLLTLLITFVVSIATGIVTVSLMEQAPKSVPETINNVIQRTIEKVSTDPTTTTTNATDTKGSLLNANESAMVSIYPKSYDAATGQAVTTTDTPKELGQGVIISDTGLILVDSNILTGTLDTYAVTLDKVTFDATVLKKFTNGFTILKLSQQKTAPTTPAVPAPTTTPTTPTAQ
jgi:hypothetical protein